MTVGLVRQNATAPKSSPDTSRCVSGLRTQRESFKEFAATPRCPGLQATLAEAEKAKAAAHEKMERLRKSQAET